MFIGKTNVFVTFDINWFFLVINNFVHILTQLVGYVSKCAEMAKSVSHGFFENCLFHTYILDYGRLKK